MRRRTTAGIGLGRTEWFAAVVLPEMERHTTAVIRAQNEAREKNCPSIFTLNPSRDFNLLKEDEQLELILYCEQDAGWHPTSHSVYRFPLESKRLDWVKEKWNQFERITKYVAPLVKVAGKAHSGLCLRVRSPDDCPRSNADQCVNFPSYEGKEKAPAISTFALAPC